MEALSKNIFLFSLFLGIILFFSNKAFASVAGDVNKANDLYKQGKIDDSLKLYRQALGQDSQSPVIDYDLGTALYKKGDYNKALGFLEQAAEDKNLNIKPKAEYNLGNALFKSGVQKENKNADEAIKTLQQALGHYGQTLAVEPKDQDAVYNENVVKKEIERLKKQKQRQQQQQNQQQQNQNQQQKKKQLQSQQNQNQQGQKSQQSQQNQTQQQKQQNQQQSGQQKQQKKNASRQQEQRQGQEESQKDIERKQAEDLLEDYRENEEPKRLLNYAPKKIDDRPVFKDW